MEETYSKHRFHIIIGEVDVENQGVFMAETYPSIVSIDVLKRVWQRQGVGLLLFLPVHAEFHRLTSNDPPS